MAAKVLGAPPMMLDNRRKADSSKESGLIGTSKSTGDTSEACAESAQYLDAASSRD